MGGPRRLALGGTRTEPDRAQDLKLTMPTNPPAGDGHHNGAVRDRSQFKNPVNGTLYKRNGDAGRIMDGKRGGKPFKGVRRERPRDA
jgi:hypothetical protein